MKKVTVQAYEDRSRAEGGHAVILLQGVTQPKGLVAYRIRPSDAARASGGEGGWIGGEHLPVAVSGTDYGLELVAGPEVTESELLLPGTVVEIQLPSSGVRGEFLWPNVAPVMRPKRKVLAVGKRGARAEHGKLNGSAAASHEAIAVASATKPANAPVDPDHLDGASATSVSQQTVSGGLAPSPLAAFEPEHAPGHEASLGTKPAAPRLETEEPSMSEMATPETPEPHSAATPISHAWVEPERAPSVPPATGELYAAAAADVTPVSPEASGGVAHGHPETSYSETEISREYGWAFKKDLSILLDKKFFALGASRHDLVQEAALRATSETHHHTVAADATAILARHDEEAHADERPLIEPVQPSAAAMGSTSFSAMAASSYQPASYQPAGSAMFAAEAHSRALPERPVPTSGGGRSAELMVLALLAALGLGGLAAVMFMTRTSADSADGAAAPAAVAAIAPAPQAPVLDLAPLAVVPRPETPLLFEALVAGETSPRGLSAGNVAADKALENANGKLVGAGADRDTDEGSFWLKRYIAGSLGEARTMRVLTQLGSTYAEPASGTPDYTRARLVWEISSAAGDPVAMCFLGLLYENGLGVTVDRKAALGWYERSKEKGGCPSVDQSIARVSR